MKNPLEYVSEFIVQLFDAFFDSPMLFIIAFCLLVIAAAALDIISPVKSPDPNLYCNSLKQCVTLIPR